MTNAVLDLLTTRRSAKPLMLVEPAPSAAELEQILAIASRVPDHKKLAPWRFIVIEGDARARLGEDLAAACLAEDKTQPSEARLEGERNRLMRSPLVVCVVSRVTPTAAAPEWEQILSAGAACFNMCLAANAMGYGTCWLTEWIAYSPRVRTALKLAENERVAGFVYMGTAKEKQPERERPALGDIVTRWGS
jgi:nitroreductase